MTAIALRNQDGYMKVKTVRFGMINPAGGSGQKLTQGESFDTTGRMRSLRAVRVQWFG